MLYLPSYHITLHYITTHYITLGKFKLDREWIGYDLVQIKSYETTQRMRMIPMCYEKWNEIKPKINARFTEVATIYGVDMKAGGGRPSKNDKKYAVFGYPVKFLRHPSQHIKPLTMIY